MTTAKALGFKKGDYAINQMGWVCKLIQYVNTTTPMCEVWGFEHEFGSVYANELNKISEQEALRIIERGVREPLF